MVTRRADLRGSPPKEASVAFEGFRPETFTFLAGLTMNNERAWFEAHRNEYERFVVEPALALITALDPVVRSISPRYRGVAKKIGGALMRIYRDTRFSNDKTPYKTNIGIQFRHEAAKDVHAPGWYVHADLSECFAGAGTWHPEPADLVRIRRSLTDRPEVYTRAVAEAGRAGLTPAGETLQRSPKGFDPGHALAAEVRRKDYFVSTPLDPLLYLGPGLVDALASRFRATAAYMALLCEALGAPF
jgi:uncharacterized protein (TIGR02453 family)